ncbi:MAG TPA: hypothetical protein VGG85_12445 [Terracidiphilus sp.]|jgi:hypothetical protein
MQILIQGQDCTAALDSIHPLKIERKLNEPSICRVWLTLPSDGSIASPSSNQTLAIVGDDGTPYFTGYIVGIPLPMYAGMAAEGPIYRLAVCAISDEILADQFQLPATRGAAGMSAGALMDSLVKHTGCTELATGGLTLKVPVSQFIPEPGASWSKCAGQLANAVRCGYRALQGSLELSEIPVVVHAMNEADGSLNLANLTFTSNTKRTLASDVTVCGEREPTAYVTEYFVGDGISTQFELSANPFFSSSSLSKIIKEDFNQNNIDLTVWSNSGGSGYFSLGADGLTMSGGSGIDGDTELAWIDSIEIGGTLLLEASGITLSAGSSGILAGLFTGLTTAADCIAGFQAVAQPGSGQVNLQPLILGVATGSCHAVNPANQYALRIRVHCPESQRALAIFRSFGDNGSIANGGQSDSVSAKLLFEIQEFVDGIASMPVVLYDGSIAEIPETCSVVAASSLNLVGKMRSFNLTNLGSGWVVSTPSNGSSFTRRLGGVSQSAECYLDRSGKLVFYAGFAPSAGERIAVSYRMIGRAIGRAMSSSQTLFSQARQSPVVTWTGTVINPAARSSADCRNAARSIVGASSSINALWSGTYTTTNLNVDEDVWPGDALQLMAPSMGLDTQLVVRSVNLTYHGSLPDLVNYDIVFANDWADDLAIKTSSSVPSDVRLPATIFPNVLPNLPNMTVTTLTGTSVTIDTGSTAPMGGGFEVRRRDFAFMAGNDTDLVMRGTQQRLIFSRESANDRFYIRMYDGTTPPNYSEFSAALFINLPLGS